MILFHYSLWLAHQKFTFHFARWTFLWDEHSSVFINSYLIHKLSRVSADRGGHAHPEPLVGATLDTWLINTHVFLQKVTLYMEERQTTESSWCCFGTGWFCRWRQHHLLKTHLDLVLILRNVKCDQQMSFLPAIPPRLSPLFGSLCAAPALPAYDDNSALCSELISAGGRFPVSLRRSCSQRALLQPPHRGWL